jgi:hypothetical protein
MESRAMPRDHVWSDIQKLLIYGKLLEKPSNNVVGVVGKIIMSYQVLDMMLSSSDWPPCVPFTHVARIPLPDVGPALAKIRGNLADWTSVIPDVTKWASPPSTTNGTATNTPGGTALPMTQPMPINPFITPMANMSGPIMTANDPTIQNLMTFMSHRRMAQVHDVMEQWHAVGFAVAAIRPVRINSRAT